MFRDPKGYIFKEGTVKSDAPKDLRASSMETPRRKDCKHRDHVTWCQLLPMILAVRGHELQSM